MLDEREYHTLERLTDLIVPVENGAPGALAAGAAAWIDTISSENDQLRAIYKDGLAWLDAAIKQRGGTDFLSATLTDQTALLDLIAYRRNQSPELAAGIEFFTWVRRMTVDAFYTSEIGIRDIDYRGNSGMTSYPSPTEAIAYALKRSGLEPSALQDAGLPAGASSLDMRSVSFSSFAWSRCLPHHRQRLRCPLTDLRAVTVDLLLDLVHGVLVLVNHRAYEPAVEVASREFRQVLLQVPLIAVFFVRRAELDVRRGRRFAKVSQSLGVVPDQRPRKVFHLWIRCALFGHLAELDLGAVAFGHIHDEVAVDARAARADGAAATGPLVGFGAIIAVAADD